MADSSLLRAAPLVEQNELAQNEQHELAQHTRRTHLLVHGRRLQLQLLVLLLRPLQLGSVLAGCCLDSRGVLLAQLLHLRRVLLLGLLCRCQVAGLQVLLVLLPDLHCLQRE